MDEVIKEMQQLKESINQANTDVATSTGRLSSLTDRLKKEHKYDSAEKAEKVVEKNKTLLEDLKKKIIEKFGKLKEEYEF